VVLTFVALFDVERNHFVRIILYFSVILCIKRPPLWSSGQEFLATDPEARVRILALPEKKVVGLERGPLSLVSRTEELFDRKVAAPV
jgi:hypothetical protein